MTELRVAIRAVPAFPCFAVGLQAEVQLFQQLANHGVGKSRAKRLRGR